MRTTSGSTVPAIRAPSPRIGFLFPFEPSPSATSTTRSPRGTDPTSARSPTRGPSRSSARRRRGERSTARCSSSSFPSRFTCARSRSDRDPPDGDPGKRSASAAAAAGAERYAEQPYGLEGGPRYPESAAAAEFAPRKPDAPRMFHGPPADGGCERRPRAPGIHVSLQKQSRREIARLRVRGWLPASRRKPRDHALDGGIEVRRGCAPQEALAGAAEE